MMKLKKFDDAEFECIGVEHTGNPDDKVGFNVRLVLKNDINDLVFSCTLTGTVNERLDILNNPPIGKSVTVKFYERTKMVYLSMQMLLELEIMKSDEKCWNYY